MTRWAPLVLAAGLCTCADVASPGGSDTAALFPHPDDYSRTHMDDALVNADTCMSCHWAIEGNIEPIAPPCDTCHRWSAYETYDETEGGR